jgi:hypothetical protein
MMQRFKNALWIFDIGAREMDGERPPGWQLPAAMFGFLAFGMVAGATVGWAAVEWWLTVVGIADFIVAWHFVHWSQRRIRRMGIVGPSRARWWIELAALDWTLCLSSGIFWVTHGLFAGMLPPWLQMPFATAARLTGMLFYAFIAFASTGYILGLIRGVRIRGRSLELVSFFFWMIVGMSAAFLLPQNPALGGWVAEAFAIVGVAASCVAGLVAARQWLAKSMNRLAISSGAQRGA